MSFHNSFIGINETNEFSNNNIISKINFSKSINQNNILTYEDLNNTLLKNNPIDKLNSKSASEYLNSLHLKLRNLINENEQLKINFIQVSEILEKEREENNKKKNILNSNFKKKKKKKKKTY